MKRAWAMPAAQKKSTDSRAHPAKRMLGKKGWRLRVYFSEVSHRYANVFHVN